MSTLPVVLQNVPENQINFNNGIQAVSIVDLNVEANKLLYSPNGASFGSATIQQGLSLTSGNLNTIGNPEIQLTSNSLFANDNLNSIQSRINSATSGDVIYISSGSFGERLTINNKTNIALVAPYSGIGNSICEVLDGLNLSGTSAGIRFCNIQFEPFEGGITSIAGVGSHVFSNCVFQGFSGNSNQIIIGANSTQYITFNACEFDSFCDIFVQNTFANVVYFINCNFNGATITCNNSLPIQVIFNNCNGLDNLVQNNKFTKIGLNVSNSLAEVISDQFTVRTNGILDFGTQPSFIKLNGASSENLSANQVIATDGAQGLKFITLANPLYYVDSFSAQYASGLTDNPLTIFAKASQDGFIPSKATKMDFSLNIETIGGSNDVLTLDLIDDTTTNILDTLIFEVDTARQVISGSFHFTLGDVFTLSFSIKGTLANAGHDIRISTNMCHSITIQQDLS